MFASGASAEDRARIDSVRDGARTCQRQWQLLPRVWIRTQRCCWPIGVGTPRGVHRFSAPGNNGVIGPLGESSHECRGYGLAILEESRKKAAPEKERLLPWLNQTPTADEANHNAMRDLRARLVPRLYLSGGWRLIQGNSHRIQRIPACAKSNGVTAFLTNAVVSPAIFLAIEESGN